jgi:hypothetical protein
MRKLIVLGVAHHALHPDATERIKDALHMRFPEHVEYPEDVAAAFELVDADPEAILAYAPGVFGDAAAGRKLSPKIATTTPQIMISTAGLPSDWHDTPDPRQFVDAAFQVLKPQACVSIDHERGLDYLAILLGAPVTV